MLNYSKSFCLTFVKEYWFNLKENDVELNHVSVKEQPIILIFYFFFVCFVLDALKIHNSLEHIVIFTLFNKHFTHSTG